VPGQADDASTMTVERTATAMNCTPTGEPTQPAVMQCLRAMEAIALVERQELGWCTFPVLLKLSDDLLFG
jgi:hypothetical protein